MALIKAIVTPTGATGNYWAIQKMTYDRPRQTCLVELGCWISKDAKKVNKFAPIEVRQVELSGDLYPSETPEKDQVAELYQKIVISAPQTVGLTDPGTGEPALETRETNWWADAESDEALDDD